MKRAAELLEEAIRLLKAEATPVAAALAEDLEAARRRMEEGGMRRRVFHPFHRTAWSRRTSGMPVYAVDGAGRRLAVFRSSKSAETWKIPEGTAALVWMYWSNSGRLSVRFLAPEDGLPERGRWDAEDGLEALDGVVRDVVGAGAVEGVRELVGLGLEED